MRIGEIGLDEFFILLCDLRSEPATRLDDLSYHFIRDERIPVDRSRRQISSSESSIDGRIERCESDSILTCDDSTPLCIRYIFEPGSHLSDTRGRCREEIRIRELRSRSLRREELD